jgi:hypothetical protein
MTTPGSASPISKIRAALLWLGVWLALVGAGMAMMMRYDFTAGTTGEAPQVWPADSTLAHVEGRPTLILFAHPKCPCTRASLAALGDVLAHHSGRVTVHVVFLQAKDKAEDWTGTDLWRSATEIPGVRVSDDEDGTEADRFGGETSGDVVLYNADGHLAFHGGITVARGHYGASAGSAALDHLLAGEPAALTHTPVFGCPLRAPVCPVPGTP